LISGVKGTVIIDGKKMEFPVRTSITDSVIDFSSLETIGESWVQYNPNPSTFVYTGNQSDIKKDDYTFTLESGTIWVKSKNIRVISSDIRVEPGSSPNQETAEYVVTTEPNKVRVFVLSESVRLTAFGKTQTAAAGSGFSLFLDRAYTSDYKIGSPVRISNPVTNSELPLGFLAKGIMANWSVGERAESYTVMTTNTDSTHAYTDVKQVNNTDLRLRYLEDGDYTVKITYQNNYATWGEVTDDAYFSVANRTFVPIEKPVEPNTAAVQLREFEGEMLIGAALNFQDDYLSTTDLNAVVYAQTDKWWLQPLDVSFYQPVYKDGYFESISRIGEAYSVIFFDPTEFTPSTSFETKALPTTDMPGVKAVATIAHPTR
jgi:hypothetical protein